MLHVGAAASGGCQCLKRRGSRAAVNLRELEIFEDILFFLPSFREGGGLRGIGVVEFLDFLGKLLGHIQKMVRCVRVALLMIHSKYHDLYCF